MPKGKVRKKSKKGSNKKVKSKDESPIEKAIAEQVLTQDEENTGEWIKIHFQLLHWNFMNFSSTFCTRTTTLKKIRDVLEERHDTIMVSLKLYLNEVAVDKELSSDEHLTLKACGIIGGQSEEKAPEITIIYDYKQSYESDAVLLSFKA